MLNRRTVIVGSLALLSTATVISAKAQPVATGPTELLMFDQAGCPWCLRWRAEVGPGYPKSAEGRRAPLRTIDIGAPRPPGITLASPVRATPTFVLVENGREIGRIVGYPGADFFWSMLDGLMKKLTDSAG